MAAASLIAGDVGMCSDFAEGGGVSRSVPGADDGDNCVKEGTVGGARAASRVREEGADDVKGC